jgi:hypothetical protein
MRVLIVAVAILLLTWPALAQGRKGGRRNNPEPQQTEEQKRKAKEAEEAYKSALDKIPDQKYDPWGNIRDTKPKAAKKPSASN